MFNINRIKELEQRNRELVDLMHQHNLLITEEKRRILNEIDLDLKSKSLKIANNDIDKAKEVYDWLKHKTN